MEKCSEILSKIETCSKLYPNKLRDREIHGFFPLTEHPAFIEMGKKMDSILASIHGILKSREDN
jgi:hypothetical protein